MHLIPPEAVIQKNPERTFADLRAAMVLTKDTIHTRTFGSDESSQIACQPILGSGVWNETLAPSFKETAESATLAARFRRRYLQHVKDATVCNNKTNFYCWMTCEDIPDADKAEAYLAEGLSLYCVDPSVMASSDDNVAKAQVPCTAEGIVGKAMSSGCHGEWQLSDPNAIAQRLDVPTPTPSATEDSSSTTQNDKKSEVKPPVDDTKSSDFCFGGTSMYMDGFNWFGDTCAIYLFRFWVLNSRFKLLVATIGTIFYGMVMELVIRLRRDYVPMLTTRRYSRLVGSAMSYGAQLTLGYSLMLVVMIYSIPLFFAVILGLCLGHVAFNAKDALVPPGALSPSTAKETHQSCCTAEEDEGDANAEGEEAIPDCCSGKSTVAVEDEKRVPEGSTPCCQHII